MLGGEAPETTLGFLWRFLSSAEVRGWFIQRRRRVGEFGRRVSKVIRVE